MKFETVSAEPAFQPIVLQITLETALELGALKRGMTLVRDQTSFKPYHEAATDLLRYLEKVGKP